MLRESLVYRSSIVVLAAVHCRAGLARFIVRYAYGDAAFIHAAVALIGYESYYVYPSIAIAGPFGPDRASVCVHVISIRWVFVTA